MNEKYEDIINEKYKKLVEEFESVKKTNNYKLEIINDNFENRTIDIYSNNKKIMSVSYEILGMYDPGASLFVWGHKFNIANSKLVKLAKLIQKSYNVVEDAILSMKYYDIEYLERIYYYLKNDMFYIDPENINSLTIISLVLSNAKGILIDNTTFMNKKNPTKTIYLVTDILTM